jgi:hypothetical protein
VLVYRGTSEGKLDDKPSWAIHLEPALRVDGSAFGQELDVVGGALVVRVPNAAAKGANGAVMPGAGGLWVFPPGSLGPPASQGRVRVVTTELARARAFGAAAGKGFGRSATLGAIEQGGAAAYVVSSVSAASAGMLSVFSVAQIASQSGVVTPVLEAATGPQSDLEGARIAALRGKGQEAGGLAVWAPWRTTSAGPFVGAIDVATRGASPFAARWNTHASAALAGFGASDRAGTNVALATLRKGSEPEAIVGAPGASSPPSPGHAAGERLRAGTIAAFGDEPSTPVALLAGTRGDAQLGNAAMTTLDFDGDGAIDLAIADPSEAAGGPPAANVVDPDACSALDPKGQSAANAPARGVVHVYALEGGALVERFRVTAPRENAHEGDSPRYWRGRTGFALAAADVNGDGKDDLVIGRPGTRDASGAEVVLGRKADASGKVVIACNGGEAGAMGATVLPVVTAEIANAYGAAVARVGDLDHDGCDEVAFSVRAGGFPSAPRAGVAIAFGYDASGARCHGHHTPFVLHVVPDDHPLADDVAGEVAKRADDTLDLRGAPTFMGATLARGAGDVTGDGVPDLVFRDLDLAWGDMRGPAVEIVSGAMVASLCPNHACTPGRHGALWSDKDWHVLALRPLAAPDRRVLPSSGTRRGFGTSLALGDATGDGVADLAIGCSDDSDAGAFAGEVRVFEGGAALAKGDGAADDPWLVAVGDVSERGGFGTSMALARGRAGAWLLVGAPASSRWHTGSAIGAAYRWHIEGGR